MIKTEKFKGATDTIRQVIKAGKHRLRVDAYIYQDDIELPEQNLIQKIYKDSTAFFYVVRNIGRTNIEWFMLQNPDKTPIPLVGTYQFEIRGLKPENFKKPGLLYAGTDSVQIQFQAGQKGLLKPGEWSSLVVGTGKSSYGDVDAYILGEGGGFGSIKMLGPVQWLEEAN